MATGLLTEAQYQQIVSVAGPKVKPETLDKIAIWRYRKWKILDLTGSEADDLIAWLERQDDARDTPARAKRETDTQRKDREHTEMQERVAESAAQHHESMKQFARK